MAKWTQEQAVAFECARECITDMMGICSAKIAEEEGKTDEEKANGSGSVVSLDSFRKKH